MVIAIIGILIALLLPAVQAAREAARRTQCANKLKQLGLAVHLHHEQRGVLPTGVYFSMVDPRANNSAWSLYLLPFMEQQNLYDQVDWDTPFVSDGNIAITSRTLSIFQCPSATPVEPLEVGGVPQEARGNYVANNGFGPMVEHNLDTQVEREAGAFYFNSKLRWADFRDGTSHTALLSEICLQPGNELRGCTYSAEGSFYHHNHPPNSSTPDELRAGWCINTPRAPCIEAFASHKDRAVIMSARSNHPGGVELLLGDGSVRFISEAIDLATWQALSTPAGGELAGSF